MVPSITRLSICPLHDSYAHRVLARPGRQKSIVAVDPSLTYRTISRSDFVTFERAAGTSFICVCYSSTPGTYSRPFQSERDGRAFLEWGRPCLGNLTRPLLIPSAQRRCPRAAATLTSVQDPPPCRSLRIAAARKVYAVKRGLPLSGQPYSSTLDTACR